MSDCKRASLSQIINLFIPAKYVELGDKAPCSNRISLNPLFEVIQVTKV